MLVGAIGPGAVPWHHEDVEHERPAERTGDRLGVRTGESRILQRARRFADDRLLPAAAAIDALDEVPEPHLQAMADRGFFGLGAAGLSASAMRQVIAAFAGGSLGVAFLWLQHQGALAAVARSDQPGISGSGFTAALAARTVRAGVAVTGLSGPDPLTARPSPGGWTLTCTQPWLTGWGAVDVVLVNALTDDDRVVGLLVDAPAAGDPVPATVAARPIDLVAARATATATVRFTDHPVPADRLVTVTARAALTERDAAGLAQNGALALGVAERALTLAGGGPLHTELAAATTALAGDPGSLPAARATVSALAVRAAALLAARTGASAVVRGSDAERLSREALFLLVFGSRPAIRAQLLTRLAAPTV